MLTTKNNNARGGGGMCPIRNDNILKGKIDINYLFIYIYEFY